MNNQTPTIDYEKRKNTDLFKLFQKDTLTFFSEIQNYIPIYNRFFMLNETNYNSVNLNHTWFLNTIKSQVTDNKSLYTCTVQHVETAKTKKTQVFLKMAPLLDPFKYLIGKYNINDPALFTLPNYNSVNEIGTVHPKIIDHNNSAYVDGFFSFISSTLIHKYNFIHGVDYYGSFLGIKQNFKLNVIDDLDYLCKSDFFNKNKNIKFSIDDYSYLYDNEEKKLQPIVIDHNTTNKSALSIQSIDDTLFDDVFVASESDSTLESHLTLTDLKENSMELVDVINSDITTTIKSNSSGSSCSSRTSHTSDGEHNDSDTETNSQSQDNDDVSDNSNKTASDDDSNGQNSDSDSDSDSDSGNYEEEFVYATIPKFPVQVICMENCDSTFDELIMNNNLTHDEWFSALLQVIMILLTYQKTFSFTHNDLHTNNIMYNTTDVKYIYYCYNKKYYKVPTFGRIFKMIDFGRAIYKFNGKLFCSDSFQPGGDAATQYNTEPYFNDKKPRLEPNYSFDLCRLACSIFDYIIDDLDMLDDYDNCPPIVKLINEWCIDDNGINILYKNNGTERYPDFKLYKMIARCVHNHTPQAQLEREEFKHFMISKNKLPADQVVINIDAIPSLTA